MNPTNSPYSFHWIQESIDGTTSGINTNMVCTTSRGTISPGKKYEIVFEYKVNTLELTETFWRFSIDNHSLSVPFLIVAHGVEPNISLDRSHINFKQLLIGISLFCPCFFIRNLCISVKAIHSILAAFV